MVTFYLPSSPWFLNFVAWILRKVGGFSLCMLLFLTGCQTHSERQILPPDKMQLVLKDIMLLETFYQSKYGTPSVYGKSLKKATRKIFAKHQVTEKQYTISFDYYASHPMELKAIQEKIIEQLNRENK
jgi:hypothetical protein